MCRAMVSPGLHLSPCLIVILTTLQQWADLCIWYNRTCVCLGDRLDRGQRIWPDKSVRAVTLWPMGWRLMLEQVNTRKQSSSPTFWLEIDSTLAMPLGNAVSSNARAQLNKSSLCLMAISICAFHIKPTGNDHEKARCLSPYASVW